jgi:site-specific DNA-methyltransferase (adenine-specific)
VAPRRKPTSTSNFGAGRRESHDATDFYARFTPPKIDTAAMPVQPTVVDDIFCETATRMTQVADNSVALVVTSPPYFAGKAYEEELGQEHIPASYLEFLTMLREVFTECRRVLEPGGRIAVNVANLGRRPYRSLSADVIGILQDLELLLRGEIIWQKAHGAGGSCAWGSFQSAANPVLRDLTERVVVASKHRFDRAMSRRDRELADPPFPSRVSLYKDEFMEATTDLWDIPPEQASRVGHPAPFPVELPQRLIDLYTYEGDLVLDPFMGSGSTAVAAVRTDRHYVGYDTDEEYVALAKARVSEERARLLARASSDPRRPSLPAVRTDEEPDGLDFQARAVRDGKKAQDLAREVLEAAGFVDVTDRMPARNGVALNFSALDAKGKRWYFDVSGAFTSARAGLRRTDTLWKALGRAAVLNASTDHKIPVIFLTTDLPPRQSAGHQALRAGRGDVFVDAVEMQSAEHFTRLAEYATGESRGEPVGDLLPPQHLDD